MTPTDEQLHEIIDLGINWHTRRNHRESEVVLLISMAKELLESRKAFTKLAKMMKKYEVPAEIGKIIVEEASK